jgi:tight adherence protein C
MFDMSQIVLAGIVFLCVALGTLLVIARLMPDKWRKRIDAIRGGGHVANEDRLSRVKEIAQALGELSGEAGDEAMRRRLAQAGFRDPSVVAMHAGMRVLLSGIFLVVVPSGWGSSLRALWVVAAAAAGFFLPNVLLSHKIRQRQHNLANGLPDALDLMTIAVDAGLGLDAAMMRVTRKIGIQSPALRKELEATWMEIRAGVPRAAALRNLAERTGVEDISLLVTLLNSADQLGVPVGAALHNFSATLRLKRHQRAEEQAGKVPVKLLFPLTFLVLPVLLMVLIGPSAIQIARALTSMSQGGV